LRIVITLINDDKYVIITTLLESYSQKRVVRMDHACTKSFDERIN